MIARTGYTAEDGFEIYVSGDEATSVRVWKEVMQAGEEFGIVPVGSARETRCGWKVHCPSTVTKSRNRLTFRGGLRQAEVK